MGSLIFGVIITWVIRLSTSNREHLQGWTTCGGHRHLAAPKKRSDGSQVLYMEEHLENERPEDSSLQLQELPYPPHKVRAASRLRDN